MENSFKLYPYPVLAESSNDYIDSHFFADVTLSYENGYTQFQFNAETDNADLQRLVAENDAVYAFHMECSQTGYREVITFRSREHKYSIPEHRLNGKLQVCPFIISTKTISNYSSKSFNTDYNGYSFTIDPGSVLSVSPGFEFIIEKKKDDLAFIPSIFYITTHPEKTFKGFDVDYSQSRIGILLGEKEFQMFKILNANQTISEGLVSLIIMPALMHVIQAFKEGEQSMINYEHLRWFRAIQTRLKEIGIDLSDDKNALQDSSITDVQLAQQLLDYPLLGSLTELYNILFCPDYEDDTNGDFE